MGKYISNSFCTFLCSIKLVIVGVLLPICCWVFWYPYLLSITVSVITLAVISASTFYILIHHWRNFTFNGEPVGVLFSHLLGSWNKSCATGYVAHLHVQSSVSLALPFLCLFFLLPALICMQVFCTCFLWVCVYVFLSDQLSLGLNPPSAELQSSGLLSIIWMLSRL